MNYERNVKMKHFLSDGQAICSSILKKTWWKDVRRTVLEYKNLLTCSHGTFVIQNILKYLFRENSSSTETDIFSLRNVQILFDFLSKRKEPVTFDHWFPWKKTPGITWWFFLSHSQIYPMAGHYPPAVKLSRKRSPPVILACNYPFLFP